MPNGLGWVWLVTFALWAAVVALDLRREPRDWRPWAVSLLALFGLSYLSREGLREPNLRFVLMAGLATIVLACQLVGLASRGRRESQRSRWAADHGYEPVAVARDRSLATLSEGLRRLPFFARGRLARTEGVARRVDESGREVLVFEHSIRRRVAWYDTGGVEAAGTVVAVRNPGLWLPLFQVRPVGLFPWMDGGPMGEAVAVPSGSSFARSYRLGGQEPRNLRAMFSDDLLASLAETPGWLVEGEGEWIAAFCFDRAPSLMSLKSSTLRSARLPALEPHVRDALGVLDRIADRGRRFARRDLGAA